MRVHQAVQPEQRAALASCGLAPADPDSPCAQVMPLEAYLTAPGAGGPVVALFSGVLEPRHAELFTKERPPLLLACRQQGVPACWEIRASAVMLSDAPLPTIAPVPWEFWKVGSIGDLKTLATYAAWKAEQAKGSANAAAAVGDVMYELAANALFDAPRSAEGVQRYAHQRGPDTEIAPEDACIAALAFHDGRAYLAVKDRFGALSAEPIVAVLSGLGGKAKVNASGGGAGLGLRRVVEHSDLWAVRVSKGIACEVLSVVSLGDTRRRLQEPKSLLFHGLLRA